MAPSFLSKLVKPQSPKSRQASPTRSPGGHTPSSSLSSSLGRPSGQIVVDPAPGPSDDDDQPNVTVVPPSPRSDSQDLFSSRPSSSSNLKGSDDRPRTLSTPSRTSLVVDDPLHTPTPDHPTAQRKRSSSNIRNFLTGGSRSRANSISEDAGAPDGSRGGSSMSKKSRSQTAPPPKNGHGRAATDSVTMKHSLSNGSLSASDREDVGSPTTSPVVESPTPMRTDFGPDVGLLMTTQSTMSSMNSSNGNSFLSIDPMSKDSDAVSVLSVATSSGKKRPWRRAATSGTSPVKPSKKPTGLASAIAASGLAMVNPGNSAVPSMPGVALPPQTSPQLLPKRSRVGTTPNWPTGVDGAGAGSRSRQASMTSEPRSGEDESGSESNSSISDDDLDLDPDDIPVTGFAVASNKRNADFHELFQGIPDGDYLIEDYGCALQREILIQGRLYVSENHICFHANIFGWITDLVIPMYEVITLEKKMTAFVIPNAIQITTRTAKYTLASFLSRDTTFDVIYNVWRLARPEDSTFGESARQSLDGPSPADAGAGGGKFLGGPARKATQCACGKEGKHYSEIAMDALLPGTPEKIYNLLFASGFIKEFMINEQKLLDLQISDWIPLPDNPKLLSRNMSYIKPLNGSIGPKQTRCELRDENEHIDFDDYVSTITTTRTPEVPSGNVFSVKTRTCITWASPISSKLLVTSQVEWTGRSFIKGIIERSCIEGQKTYHNDLDKAVRSYIQQHQSEFVPEGVDPEAIAVDVTPADQPPLSAVDLRKERELERNQRGLQWAYDTFEGALGVAKRSTEGALDLIMDAWDNASTSGILWLIIIGLLISNVWTLMRVGKQEDVGRRRERVKVDDREKWVHGLVTALWDELQTSKGPPALAPRDDWRDEVEDINKALDAVEARIGGLRETLKSLN